jgi:hypothetical protein
MYGGVGGEEPQGSPLSRFGIQHFGRGAVMAFLVSSRLWHCANAAFRSGLGDMSVLKPGAF